MYTLWVQCGSAQRNLCSSAVEQFPLDAQEAEENFDLSLIASLEIDVVPYLGEASVPDYIVSQLARVLQQGSRLRSADDDLPPSPSSLPDVPLPRGAKKAHESQSSKDFDKIEKFGDGWLSKLMRDLTIAMGSLSMML